jgi:hypothetical protein
VATNALAVTGKPKLVYIAGSGRSGSTIVAEALASLDGWMTVGEVRMGLQRGFSKNAFCGCGERFHDCPFWAAVVERAYGGFAAPGFARLEHLSRTLAQNRHTPLLMSRWQPPGLRRRTAELAALFDALYSAIRVESGARVIIDSSKTPAFFYALSRSQAFDLYVAHIVRDSRAVVFSNARKVADPADPGRTAYMPQQGLLKTVAAWSVKNLWISEVMGRRTPLITVRYEDFVANPGRELRRIASVVDPGRRFCDPVQGDELRLRAHHTAGGNPVRFRQGTVKIRIDDEWRARMEPAKRRFATLLSWPVLAKYRYVVRDRTVPDHP